MAKNNNLTDFVVDIADAIREKEGSTDKINPQDFHDRILAIKGAEETPIVEEKDVNFYDYDGTLLFSYTLAEAQALTELPTPKGHDGLVFDGWNWDYEDVIALDYPMDIGALYMTDDGKTRIYIDVATKAAMDVPLYFSQSVSRGVVIDWGDGSPSETIEGTGFLNVAHHYNNIGKYRISLDVAENCSLILGSNQGNMTLLGEVQNSNPLTYATYLDKVELGYRTALNGNAFKSSLLRSITFNSLSGISGAPFYAVSNLSAIVVAKSTLAGGVDGVNQATNAYSISHLMLPKITRNSGGIANNCRNIKRIRLSATVLNLLTNVIRGCYSITYFEVPAQVKEIGQHAISDTPSLRILDCRRCKQVPLNKGFNSIPTEAIVVVPDALYDEWISATNWAAIADQIIKASDYESQNG